MISIQTNVNSLVAQQNLNVNSAFQAKTIQQLTSGYRINSSGDDAAGLAVANKFRNSIAELTQGVANGNDATAQLQIMDGGMNNIGQMLDRLKTLAMQSASGAFSGGDDGRKTLNKEFQNTITEIDRQAQSIGLNTGGTFAKSLSIYLGAGSGSQSAANSVVNVDLAQSTVDTQSLGLKGVQAVNGAAYDLGTASSTSVANIVKDVANITSAGATAAPTFTFFGAGISDDSSDNKAYAADGNNAGVNNIGVAVKVNLNGVSDTTGLVNAINSAIQAVGLGNTGADASLKAAAVTASIVTDSKGNQKLAFNSSASGFDVQAGDRMASALMGNFAGDGTSAATGAEMGTAISGRNTLAAAKTGSLLDFSTNHVTLTVTGAGLSAPKSVTLSTDCTGANDADYTALNTAINNAFSAAGVGLGGITASEGGGKLLLTSTQGAFTVSASGLGVANLGMDSSTTAGTAADASGKKLLYDYTSAGAYQLGSVASDGTVTAMELGFRAAAGAQSQSITISGNDASGKAHSTTVNLDLESAGTFGSTINDVAAQINSKLQKSDDPTLQGITAVVKNDNGVAKLNFVSTLSDFSVSTGIATGSAGGYGNISSTVGLYETDSTNSSKAYQGKTYGAAQIGAGGSADISSQAGAQSAVAAITGAVAALGNAQAAIGKGQNALGYAINLANSQITNLAAAESQIRDTNVAQQAANLSKAQTLSQASIAAMAQANSAPQAVLSLLRG